MVSASIISSHLLLLKLADLSLKSIEGTKTQMLLDYTKDLDSAYNALAYNGKDAILKKIANEENPASNFQDSLEIFMGQLSQITGQLISLHKDEDAKAIQNSFASIHDELLKWGTDLNTGKLTTETANSELKALRKKLKESIKTNLNFKTDEGASVQGILNFVYDAQTKFKILNLTFIGISILVLIFCFALLSQMTTLLNKIIVDLKFQFDKLGNLSNNLNQQSANLSSATQEQASAIQETVATMEEMTAMVKSNTHVAESSQVAVSENTTMANSGVNSIGTLVNSINEVKSFSDALPKQVEANGAELIKIINVIHEISNKTKVINDIVFQTKLLSFNASVEAARAGEQGKGFAVVAEEVGNLAQMSSNASKEISDLLEASIKIVNETVESNKANFLKSSSDITVRVRKSFENASDCTKILHKIEEKANMIGDLMGEINTASNEQTRGIEGVNVALCELEQVSTQNSIVASSTAKMGHELQDNAQKVELILNELVIFLKGAA
jgi:methyl-accepting chemotaxis protein